MPLAQKLHLGEGAISGSCHGSILQCVLPELSVGGLAELSAQQSKDSQCLNRGLSKQTASTAGCITCGFPPNNAPPLALGPLYTPFQQAIEVQPINTAPPCVDVASDHDNSCVLYSDSILQTVGTSKGASSKDQACMLGCVNTACNHAATLMTQQSPSVKPCDKQSTGLPLAVWGSKLSAS